MSPQVRKKRLAAGMATIPVWKKSTLACHLSETAIKGRSSIRSSKFYELRKMGIIASIFIVGIDEASRIFQPLLVGNGTVVRKILVVPHLIIPELQITKSYHALDVICARGGARVNDQPPTSGPV